jgi:hypothetical protein
MLISYKSLKYFNNLLGVFPIKDYWVTYG